ncbi:MAG: hypothetical protein A2Z31_09795 [candidate division NC10 bacterium RBG_16_65_8]|nr:MAG: hypothetical protein A2Z31_09795 [candidate division NC10 bacterium RBG_16_65_8]
MASGLLTRLIEGASDSLARAIYRRILDDRRAAKGQALPSGVSATWEQIVASAMEERVLDPTEATALLVEMCNEQATAVPRNAHNRGRWRRRAALQAAAGRRARSARRYNS